MTGSVIDAAKLELPLSLDADVVIVGSSAGGSVLAARLTAAGLRGDAGGRTLGDQGAADAA